MVGAVRFELTTYSSQSCRATRLRYAPILNCPAFASSQSRPRRLRRVSGLPGCATPRNKLFYLQPAPNPDTRRRRRGRERPAKRCGEGIAPHADRQVWWPKRNGSRLPSCAIPPEFNSLSGPSIHRLMEALLLADLIFFSMASAADREEHVFKNTSAQSSARAVYRSLPARWKFTLR